MDNGTLKSVLEFIRELYPTDRPVPLHAPRFRGNERKYLCECIDSTYVSYVGKFVQEFESHVLRLTGARHAIALVNGTAALHMSLLAVGVKPGDGVITQALTFAATAAAIRHAQAEPIFVDVDRDTLGMGPAGLRSFLSTECARRSDGVYDKASGRRIAAVVPMHTFGQPARIEEIVACCNEAGVPVVEDAAESIGSTCRGKSTGTFGRAAILSFNGNKPVTTGGGGMVLTDDDQLAARIRHIATTAKKAHQWEFDHDDVGYNYRLPNLNAAIGCAQMECFGETLANKRETAEIYRRFFDSIGVPFVVELRDSRANYWLNAIILHDRAERDRFLEYSNENGVQTRPIWKLMSRLAPYRGCRSGDLSNSEWLEDRVVNVPSSVRV